MINQSAAALLSGSGVCGGVDELPLPLSAKGLTHGQIAAHLAEVYGTEVSSRPSPPSPTR